MRQIVASIVGLLFLALGSVTAHEPGRDKATADVGKGKVTIDYGTPTLGKRSLDEMIEPGIAWRMGMNNATILEATVALDFGGKALKPGKYTLFARSDGEGEWTLLISTGTRARLDPATVVVEAPLHFMRHDSAVDPLKITLDKSGAVVSLTVAWGNYRLHGSFKAAA